MISIVFQTPKRHILAWKHFTWRILCQNPFRHLGCMPCKGPPKSKISQANRGVQSDACVDVITGAYFGHFWSRSGAWHSLTCTKFHFAMLVIRDLRTQNIWWKNEKILEVAMCIWRIIHDGFPEVTSPFLVMPNFILVWHYFRDFLAKNSPKISKYANYSSFCTNFIVDWIGTMSLFPRTIMILEDNASPAGTDTLVTSSNSVTL